MIVHNEETLEEAVGLVKQGLVRYSDQFVYRLIDSETLLRNLVLQAFSREDVAVVAPLGQERSMENHTMALRTIKAQRREAEAQAVKKWVREHPEVKKAESEHEILRIIHGHTK